MIWLIGCNGMLGSELGNILTQKDISWIGSDKEVDITNHDELDFYSHSYYQFPNRAGHTSTKKDCSKKITWVINCAAYTDITGAEENPEQAEAVNNIGALNVTRTTRKIGAKLIHLSSSSVYDGNLQGRPFTEESFNTPVNKYGQSKLDGDNSVQKEMTQYYILRTSWLYGSQGNNFVKSVMRDVNLNAPVKIANDMVGSPTSAKDLAEVILKIIDTSDNATSLFGKNSALPYGIYNFSNQGVTSRIDFAKKIFEIVKKQKKIKTEFNFESCPSSELPSEKYLQKYDVLDCSKIKAGLKLKVPSWESSLEKFVKACIQQGL